jgi:hypothetical protein
MRLAWRLSRGIQERYIHIFWEDLRGREHLEDVSVNENIILKWIFKKW